MLDQQFGKPEGAQRHRILGTQATAGCVNGGETRYSIPATTQPQAPCNAATDRLK